MADRRERYRQFRSGLYPMPAAKAWRWAGMTDEELGILIDQRMIEYLGAALKDRTLALAPGSISIKRRET